MWGKWTLGTSDSPRRDQLSEQRPIPTHHLGRAVLGMFKERLGVASPLYWFRPQTTQTDSLESQQLPSPARKRQIPLFLEPELILFIDQQARSNHQSRSDFLRRLVRREHERVQREAKP